MVSDVLSEAVDGLDHYLDSDLEIHQKMYAGDMRARIVALRNEAAAIVRELWTLPVDTEVAS